jgi:YbbR domain-containing protein
MLKSKVLNLVFAIVAAVVIWVFVTTNVNPTTTRIISDVPVELANVDSLDERRLTLSEELSFTIAVTAKGPRSAVIDLDKDDIKASADVLGFVEGNNIAVPTVTAPEEIDIASVSPPELEIKLVPLIAKQRPVKVQISNMPSDAPEIVVDKISPNRMEVTGKSSLVNEVANFLVSVDYSDIKIGSGMEIIPVPVDKKGNHIYGVTFAHTPVKVSFRETSQLEFEEE